ncbi:MAG: hypothetical protein ABSD68_02530 [Candidatus Micrarchaeales archaeon]|jgi:hypothetical protein
MSIKTTDKASEATGIDFIDNLQKRDPKRNIVYIAIDELKTTVEKIRFYDDYVALLRKSEDPSIKEDAESVAVQNIKWVLFEVYGNKYQTNANVKDWFNILDEIEALHNTSRFLKAIRS